MKTRTLKIEESGDYAAKKITPTVRLKGKWLQAAGFPPGKHLELTVISPGVIELRVIGGVA
jgi:cell division inhibitor SulA